jgi:hypothetical protein
MNGISSNNPARTKIENIIASMLETRTHSVPGIITKYYSENHVADIEMFINNTKTVRRMVPIEKPASFLDSYKIDEYVWVSFKGGSVQDPVITGKYNPTYQDKIDANTDKSAVYNRQTQYIKTF